MTARTRVQRAVEAHPVPVFLSGSAMTFVGVVVMLRTSPAAVKALAGIPQVARTLRLGS